MTRKPRRRYRYSLSHDFYATLRALVDAHVRRSRIWDRLRRDLDH